MLRFIKDHWVAYLIGAVLAVALGFGASYLFWIKGSTPDDVHAKEIAAEQQGSSGAIAPGE